MILSKKDLKELKEEISLLCKGEDFDLENHDIFEESLTIEETVSYLERYQKWRRGEIDDFSSNERTPNPKFLGVVIDHAIYFLSNEM